MNNMETKKTELFTSDQEIFALTIKQPYADLMLHGKVETRTWNTHYRGWVLICSGGRAFKQYQVHSISRFEQMDRIAEVLGKDYMAYTKARSGIAIAVGKIVDSYPMTKEDEDKCFAHYYEGLFCHVYENVRPIKPFPWSGQVRFVKIPQKIINQIEYA